MLLQAAMIGYGWVGSSRKTTTLINDFSLGSIVLHMLITQSVFLSLMPASARFLASIFSWAVKYFFIASLLFEMLARTTWCWSWWLRSMWRGLVQSNHWLVFNGEIGKVGKKAVIRL